MMKYQGGKEGAGGSISHCEAVKNRKLSCRLRSRIGQMLEGACPLALFSLLTPRRLQDDNSHSHTGTF
jgi:hypothetical protein